MLQLCRSNGTYFVLPRCRGKMQGVYELFFEKARLKTVAITLKNRSRSNHFYWEKVLLKGDHLPNIEIFSLKSFSIREEDIFH